MKRILLASVALLTVFAARSQTPEASARDYAITTGTYEKEYTPDELYLEIVIREKDSKGKKSIEEQQDAMCKELSKAGIDIEKALKTKGLSTTYYKKDQNLAFGRYELKLSTAKDFYTAAAILDELGISGANLNRIDRADRKLLELEVIAEAMKNARNKAEAIAATEGLKVGKCIYFADETSIKSDSSIKMFTGRVAGLSSNGSRASTGTDPLFPEVRTLKISASVQAKFLLE